MQSIVRSLYEIAADIPADRLGSMFGDSPEQLSNGQPSRTWSSLNMLFCQATILTIRPVMLHAAHLLLNADEANRVNIDTNSLGRLSRTCSEAARRLLNVMGSLRKRQSLGLSRSVSVGGEIGFADPENPSAIFGFFDSDAVFSAAFIMMLTAIFDTACPEHAAHNAKQGLQDALLLLQYLADLKNPFAVEKIQEVRSMWTSLSQRLIGMETLRQPVARSAASRPSQGSTALRPSADGLDRGFEPLEGNQAARSGRVELETMETADDEDTTQVPLSHLVDMVDGGQQEAPAEVSGLGNGLNTMDLLVGEYYDYYCSLSNNPEWEFRGEDVGDFNDFSRNVLNFPE